MTYTAKTFDLPELKGLSKKQIEVHLALYQGYVKHVNLIMARLKALREDSSEENTFTMNELRRRFSFEFDGMRMHEYYFDQFVGGAKEFDSDGALAKAANEKYGSAEQFITHIKDVAGTRGIGWVVVYYDSVAHCIHTVFVNDHELGQLSGLPVLLALDLWEHAYMVDYVPAEKKSYVEAFLDNVNWSVVENRISNVV